MAIGPDVLAGVLEDLEPGWIDIFTQSHPVIEKIVTGGKVSRAPLKGYLKTFNVNPGGPGKITNITSLSTPINGGRRQNLTKGSEYSHRAIYAFDVPCSDMAEASGQNDLAELIDDYPKPAYAEFLEAVAYQICTGAYTTTISDLQVTGITTLNGDTTYNPRGMGARSGLVEFKSRATQANTVEGIAKAAALNQGWTNGFYNCSSMSGEGATVVRKAYYEASQLDKAYGFVDVMLGDTTSYQNFMDYWEQFVRNDKVVLDTSPDDVREGVPYKKAVFYNELGIDLTSTAYTSGANTALTSKGVVYGLKSKAFGLFTLGKSELETKGFFEWRKPFRNPTEDSYRFECVMDMNLFCRSLKSTFAVTGLGNP